MNSQTVGVQLQGIRFDESLEHFEPMVRRDFRPGARGIHGVALAVDDVRVLKELAGKGVKYANEFIFRKEGKKK